jgi:predicted nucleic acid-binding protein
LSVLTLDETRKGIAGISQGKRRTQLEVWLEVELQERFSERILPIDSEVADLWGALAADARRMGKALPIIDGLLAATAIHHSLTIVFRNSHDFAGTPAQTVNPWEG